ncbi:MAG: hypothetical protein JW841_02660 [Deltaproteobacteria bacterium]|nr:hypothetical protein [Deltaproteobacteria bacterium]
MSQKSQTHKHTFKHLPLQWRSVLASTRLKLWKLGALPYNALVFTAAAIVIIQAKAWRIRDH